MQCVISLPIIKKKGFLHKTQAAVTRKQNKKKKRKKHSCRLWCLSPSCSLLLYDWREERERRTRRQRAAAKLRFSTRGGAKPAAAVIRLCACYYFFESVFFDVFSGRKRGKDEKKRVARARLFFLNLKRLLLFLRSR